MRPTCVEEPGLGRVVTSLRCDVLSEPKTGSLRAQYEDAWFAPRGAAAGGTVAIADGASESMLAGAWARQLVRAVGGLNGKDLDAEVFADRICAAAAWWPVYVSRYVRRRERLGRPLAWYEESKLEQGAYATLLGISFRDAVNASTAGQSTGADAAAGASASDSGHEIVIGGTWSAAALGDACGFLVRGARLAAAFPIESPDDFGSSPDLAATRAPDRALLRRRTATRRGTWLPGDVFYLATDAAAQWFLAEARARREPWKEIDRAFGDPAGWLAALRAHRRIRDDDVTIVRCRLGEEAAL